MKYLIKVARWTAIVFARSVVCRVAVLLAICLLFASPNAQVFALEKEVESPSGGLINPQAIAFSSATRKVYAVDTARDAIVVMDDTSQSQKQVKVGAGPVSIATSDATGRAYVANAGDGTVSVIDGGSDSVVTTIPVGSHPYSIAVNPETKSVYVTHTFSDSFTIIDEATDLASELKIGSADLITIDTKLNNIYLLGYEGGNLLTLNGRDHSHSSQTVGMHAWGLGLNRLTGTLYIALPGKAVVSTVNRDSQVVEIAADAIPCAVAVDEETNRIYVANYEANTVTVIDGAAALPIATIAVGLRPQALAVDSARGRIYVANTHSNSVTVIDGKTNRAVETVPAGLNPYAVVVSPFTHRVYVADENGSALTAIEVESRKETELR
jgi:YVTN family beta-propeller protein